MSTKFNDDFSPEMKARLLYEIVHLKDEKLRLEQHVADLIGVSPEQVTGAVALAKAREYLVSLRELARTNNPTERDLNCYVILCKLAELAYACLRLTEDGSPAFDDGDKE